MPDGNNTHRGTMSQPASSWLAFAVGFFFSLRTALVLFFVRVPGTEPRTGAAISVAGNLLLLALVCFHSLRPRGPAPESPRTPAAMRWVFAYLLLSGCSLLWSGTVSLAASSIYWSALVSDVAIVLILLRGGDTHSVAQSLMRGYIVSSCVLAIVAWSLPAQTDLRLGDPDYFNTNQIANLCAFAIFFAQYLMRRSRERWGFAVLFLVLTLFRSLSKTTLAAFLIAEAVVLIQDRTLRRRTKVLLTTSVIAAILIFWGLFEAYYEVYTTTGNQAETLTGRTAIWAWSLDAALEKPWLGNGFDSMWKVIPPLGADGFEARHAENELLQQFYAYGIGGILVLAGIYASTCVRIRRCASSPLKSVFTAIMIFVIIRGLAVAEPFDLLLPLWTAILMNALMRSSQEQTAFVRVEANPSSVATPLSPNLHGSC